MKNIEDPHEELKKIAGTRAQKAIKTLDSATEAYTAGRYREAHNTVKPLSEKYPQALAVKELYGLTLYSLGKYEKALKVLEEFTHDSGSMDQIPVIMDCYRAKKDYEKVDELWSELGAVSPSGEVTAEGRIVHSQSLAERGDINQALKLLRKKVKPLSRPAFHHLRLWYTLADLEERAGNIVAARQWFDRIAKIDPNFADIKYRIDQLT